MSWFSDIGKKVTKAASTLHLTSISKQLDFKKLITNPKGYATSMFAGYKKDIGFAGDVWGRFKSGDFKGLASQAASETVQAFGGSKEQASKAAGLGATVGELYGKAKGAQAAYNAAQSGDYQGAALGAAKLAGGDAAKLAGAVEKGLKFYDQGKAMLAGGDGGSLFDSLGEKLKGATGGTPLAALSKAAEAVRDDPARLIKAANPRTARLAAIKNPEEWKRYAADPETLGGLF